MSTPATGRRSASRSARPRDGLAAAGVVLVVLAAGLLAVAGAVEAAPEEHGRASAEKVERVDVACAAFPGLGAGARWTLAPDLEDSRKGGSLEAGAVGGELAPVDAAPGALTEVEVEGDRGTAAQVSAEGPAAYARTTHQVDDARSGAALAVQECGQPRSRWWFTGAAAGLDHSSSLVLANLDPGPAVVDIEVLSADQDDEAQATRGLTVQPGEVRTVDLLEVAPQAEELTVHVEASRGRVVAALADELATAPAAAAGVEWIPAQPEASRVLRLAPLPKRADRRTLVVANPSDREALVGVELAGPGGTFTPEALPQLRVPPGAVVTADVEDVVGQESAGIVLRSSVRLTATVRSARGQDIAYAAAAPALSGPSAATVPDRTRPTVQLTAADLGGRAEVTAHAADGEEVDAQTLDLEPGATVTWEPKGDVTYLVVTPEKGRVWGGVSLAGARGLSQVPLQSLPTVLRRPVVVPVLR